MAMRRETIETIELLPAWTTALSDEASIRRQMKKHRLKVRFVPSVIMVNREAISLPRFTSWMERQLVATKTTGVAAWGIVAIHAINIAGTQVFGLCVLIAGLLTGDSRVAAIAVAGSSGLPALGGAAS